MLEALKGSLLGRPGRPVRIGRYVLKRQLGRGGQGVVYVADDPKLDREVALKLLATESPDPREQERILREAQAMARLSHPNVVAVFEVGEHESKLFIAMEYVQGVTLAAWRGEERRTWQDILSKYLQAGRGLAAAHAVGLVHRDFKPGNALVGIDGRVRVLDFGLAIRRGEQVGTPPTEDPVSPASDAQARLTATGLTMGTPAYMSPEQIFGAPVDHRSDQFSLCVALWEALYGVRPFVGLSLAELRDRIKDGTMNAPNEAGVPTRLRAVLKRGLHAEPDARWPDVATMLAELEHVLSGGRHRSRAAGIVAGLAAGAGVFGLVVGEWQEQVRARALAGCEHAAALETARLWDDDRRARVRASLLGTGASHAKSTSDHVLGHLDAYADAWHAAHADACVAREVHASSMGDGSQRSAWCLEDRAMALSSLVEQLEHADDEVVARAVNAAASLARIAPCRDASELRRMPAPPEPAARQAVRDVRAQLYRARAMAATARYDDGLELARAARTSAASLERASLVAASSLVIGELLEDMGAYADAEAELADAYFTASHAHDLETAIGAANDLTHLVGVRLARHDDAMTWSRLGAVGLDELELPPDDRRRAAHASHLGLLHLVKGEHDTARQLLQRAVDLEEGALGPDHPRVAALLQNLAIAVSEDGDYDQAAALYGRAVTVGERALGPDHPQVGVYLGNLASVHLRTGDFAEAGRLSERALALQEAALDPWHPQLAIALANVGGAAMASGDLERAQALLGRAVAILERTLGPEHPDLGRMLGALANAKVYAADLEGAQVLQERSLAIVERALGPEHPDVAATLVDLAVVHFRMGDHERARLEAARAVAIVEAAHGPDHVSLGAMLALLASTYAARGDDAEALRLRRRAVDIFDAHEGVQHEEASTRLALAEALMAAESEPDPARAASPIR